MAKVAQVRVGARTDQGGTKVCEDAYYIFEDRAAPDGPLNRGLYAVADADSPASMGEAAARLTLTTVAELIEPTFSAENPSFLEELKKAALEADKRLRELAQNEQWKGIKVSLACAVVSEQRLYFLNVGTTSIYLLRNGELRELSKKAVPIGAKESVPSSMLGEESFSCDVFEVKLFPGDSILFCSDGLTEKVRFRDIAEVLHWSVSSQAACDRLISLANRAGKEDDITALVVDLMEERPHTSNWWKYALGILLLLGAGFFLAYIFTSRHTSTETPTSSSTPPSERYVYIKDLEDPYALLLSDKLFYLLDKEQKTVLRFTSYGKPDLSFTATLPGAEAPCDMVLVRSNLYILDAAGQFYRLPLEGGEAERIEAAMGEEGTLSSPRALDWDGRYFYVADRGNDRVVVLNGDFKYVGVYSDLEKPNGLAIDSQGYLYVSLKDQHKILKLDENGEIVASASTGATSIGTYEGPADIALTFNQEEVLVPEMSTDQVLVFDADLNLRYKVGRTQLLDPNFRNPKSLLASEEALYIVGGSSEDLKGFVWRIPWSLVVSSP